jgi:hypothetical protein
MRSLSYCRRERNWSLSHRRLGRAAAGDKHQRLGFSLRSGGKPRCVAPDLCPGFGGQSDPGPLARPAVLPQRRPAEMTTSWAFEAFVQNKERAPAGSFFRPRLRERGRNEPREAQFTPTRRNQVSHFGPYGGMEATVLLTPHECACAMRKQTGSPKICPRPEKDTRRGKACSCERAI